MNPKSNSILRIAASTAVLAYSCQLHAQTNFTVLQGETLNLSNGSYTFANLNLQGGTVSGSGSYAAYGASFFGNVTVSGTAASTINSSSWFNIISSTTFTVADVTSSSASDLVINTSLRGMPGSPDTSYTASAIIKEGAGTMEVNTHSYFRGGLNLNGGTLKLSGGNGGYGFFDGTVNVNSGTTLAMTSDGTGFGWQGDWKPDVVNINGGTVTGGGHIWGISGGVNMTGGTLDSSAGFQWNSTNLNTNASAVTATVSGALNLRGDGAYTTMAVNVADGTAATDLLISGVISQQFGTVGITKSGSGTMQLTGNNTYTGATTVTGGTLVVNGSIANATTTTVQSGATISGSGSVGNLTVDSGAFVNPGNSPGILTVNGAYNQAGTLVTEITGLNAGTQHDQVVVNGAVSLTGSLNVQFTGGTYSVDNLIFLLLNDSTDAVNGIFTGFNEGDTVTQYGGFDWIISYSADSSTSSFTGGNDIALRAIPEPSAAILGGLGLLGCLRRRRK
jgi:autotransporter-associated beta strand protein